ncbi:MbnP family protein [Prosthecobacter vanneervenii]|uniref:Cytochrome c peroxidase n=1 Tax=Prosthecobacter vanneervenii TaxID=48466 RepID=A0A7W7Y9S9_9BACT|nr:MbnP family protein [Prosthecobacter vanneervenii]MBB5031920.1 cytochrome c peroxidase [Prosthecobacter vanneervenii]
MRLNSTRSLLMQALKTPRLRGLVVGMVMMGTGVVAQEMRLEINSMAGGKALRMNEPVSAQQKARITRLDFLLSGLALRRKDGTWVESKDWFAYLSAGAGRMTAKGSGIPAGEYTGIRFQIGVDDATNRADPHRYAADHALNPQVNGLHWGWMGGYIFLALEGRFQNEGKEDGFSYHIANMPQLMKVDLPVEFRGGRPLTLTLDFDLEKVLSCVGFSKDGTSTHSREGDELAMRIKSRIEQSFRVRGLSYDVYQTPAYASPPAPLPAGTHAYKPAVTQRFPQVRLPTDNPLTEEGVELGRRLFQDKRLSVNQTQACASCHDQGHAFADVRRFSLGAEQQVGKRNAMPLFNLAWQPAFFWDGRAATLREQVLMPIQDAHEMNETLPKVVAKLSADAECVEAFRAAYGVSEITADGIAKALEQYLLTLVSQESRFDRAARKVAELTESEKRGLRLFVTEFDPKRGLRGADCFHCHGGTLFMSQAFANNGLALAEDDIGRMAVTKDEADRGKFKTPSLRNIARTAPYMHDGRFATLEEVVEHYSSGVRNSPTLDPNLAKHPAGGIQLTAEEKADLVAFLKTLTDESFTGGEEATTAAR